MIASKGKTPRRMIDVKRIIGLILSLMLIMSLVLNGLAENNMPQGDFGGLGGNPSEGMGEPSQGGPGGEPPQGGPGRDMGNPPDGMGGPGGMAEGDVASTGNATNANGTIDVTDGIVTADNNLTAAIGETDGTVTISGIAYDSGDYGDTLLSVSNSNVVLTGANINMNVDEAVSGNESAGTAAYVDSGTLTISDSTIEVDGAGRYTVAATATATMVVEDSVIVAGGDAGAEGNTAAVSEPASNAGLLISGNSRANFSVGQTHTFYYDSLCVTDGWAALSTDSATGSGLEFVGVNTEALALHGGYGIYADTNCRDYLYGATLVSAEVGAIISNNGAITVGSAKDAQTAVTQDGHSALEYHSGETGEDERTTIIAGRNDFQLHSPEMMGEGNSDYTACLSLSHTTLITDDSINGDGYEYTSDVNGETYTIRATEDYADKYGDAVGAYIDYVTGAAILVKSTSADITLDDVEIQSSTGVALLTALNSDSMSRYLKQDVGSGVNVTITNSAIDGDFIHDDYQRDMTVTLDGSTLNGDISFSTAEEWNEKWPAYADDESACWVNLDANIYITDTHATALTLANGSVWNVKESSKLSTLTVSADSTVNGNIEAETTETLEDGTVIYTNATVIAA